MPLSQAQIDRINARRYNFQYKFYIGGKRKETDEDNIVSGSAYDFTFYGTLDTTTRVSYDSTSLTITGTSGSWPVASDTAPKTLFLSPALSTKSPERITFTGQSSGVLSGVARHNLVQGPPFPTPYAHEVGSTVNAYAWVDVTGYIIPNFSLDWVRTGNSVVWKTQLTGAGYNNCLFERGNSIACEARYKVNGVWTSWTVQWFGYIAETPEVRYDGGKLNIFTILVEGVSQFASLFDAPAHSMGKYNLALGKPVTVSSYLQTPALLQPGETYHTSSLGGDKAVDGDINTPWVSESIPELPIVDPNHPENNNFEQFNLYAGKLIISEIYFPPKTKGDNYMWIEIYNPNGGNVSLCNDDGRGNISNACYFANSKTIYRPPFDQANLDPAGMNTNIDIRYSPYPFHFFSTLPSCSIPPFGFLVIAMDIESFERWWIVLDNNVSVVNWRRSYDTGHPESMTFNRSGDFIQLRSSMDNRIIDEVFWGNADMTTHYFDSGEVVDGVTIPAYKGPYDVLNDSTYPGQPWTVIVGNDRYSRGPRLRRKASSRADDFRLSNIEDNHDSSQSTGTIIWSGEPFHKTTFEDDIEGHSMRLHRTGASGDHFVSRTTVASDWEIENEPSPGAYAGVGTGEWISVDIGEIPTVLSRDISSVDVSISVDNGTIGFPVSGSLVIGAELITYTGKTDESFTGATITGSHSAGENVYPAKDGVESLFYPVVRLAYKRPQNKPCIKTFRVYGSTEQSPKYPTVYNDITHSTESGNPDWVNSWEQVTYLGTSGSASAYVTGKSEGNSGEVSVSSISGFPESGVFVYKDGAGTDHEVSYGGINIERDYWTGGIISMQLASLQVPHTILEAGKKISFPYYTASSSIEISKKDEPMYYRHYMLIAYEMTEDVRVMVNEIEINPVDTEILSSNETQSSDITYMKDFVYHILHDHLGIPDSKITVPTNGDFVVVSQKTQRSNVYSLLDDLAGMCGCVVRYGLSGEVIWELDPMMKYGTIEAALMDFSSSTIESPLTLKLGRKSTVSQIELYASDASNGETYHVYYPSQPSDFGSIVTVNNIKIIGGVNRAKAIAEGLYNRYNNSSMIVLKPLGIADSLTPGQCVTVSKDLKASDVSFFNVKKAYIISGISYKVSADNPIAKSLEYELACEEKLL